MFLTLFHQGGGQICPHPAQTCIPVKNQWVEILRGVLRELNSKPIFEQVTPSRSSGKSSVADLLPHRALKGPKYAGLIKAKFVYTIQLL